jgi:hypothetical protein
VACGGERRAMSEMLAIRRVGVSDLASLLPLVEQHWRTGYELLDKQLRG